MAARRPLVLASGEPQQLQTGDSLVLPGTIDEFKGANIASSGTTDIGSADGNYVEITGTTTITALGTAQAGAERVCRFTGILTLTHHATSLILPGATNKTTAVGDIAVFRSEGSGNWRCIIYSPAAGISGGSGFDNGNITIEFYSGGDSLTAGIKDSPVKLAYSGTVTAWEIMAYNSSGTLLSTSAVIDILMDTFANLPMTGSESIAGSDKPTLSSASTASDSSVSFSSLVAGQYIQGEIESVGAGVAKIVVCLTVTRSD